MANLTLTIDDELLTRARVRAREQGTSVNALVRDYLARFANGQGEGTAIDEFVALAEASDASSGPSGRQWTRDELHDR